MFLLSQTAPDYALYRTLRCPKFAATEVCRCENAGYDRPSAETKDFEHLVFNRDNSKRILRFREFIRSLTE